MPVTNALGARRWSAFVLMGITLSRCSASTSDPSVECGDRAAAPIWGADGNDSTGGQLSPEQELALGALRSASDEVICSGTLIAPRWVLSAAHCLRSERLWFTTGGGGQRAAVPVVRTFPHETRDVALLELERAEPLSDLGVRAIPLFDGDVTEAWVGRSVTLGGLGTTEGGQKGLRLFVVETIASASAAEIVVNGQGSRGACFADSGGPLLANTPGELIGVLSRGSTSCVGLDRYEPVGSLGEWVRSTVGHADLNRCAGFDWEGTCSGEGTTYCDGEKLVTETCEGEQYCGYDLATHGYRCVTAELDPCHGVGRSPECNGDILVQCQDGQLLQRDCSACGQHCGISRDVAVCQ